MRRTVLVGVAMLLTLAACGGGGGSNTSASDIVARAADRTVAARTARMSFSVITQEGQAAPTKVAGDGSVDFPSSKAALVFAMPPIAGQDLGRIEAVLDGRIVYAKLSGGLLTMLTAGKPWIRLDLDAPGGAAALGGFSQLQASDPSQALAYLRGASNDARRVGQSQLRGTKVTQYRATLDLERAATKGSESARAQTRKAIQTLKTSKVPSDVWLDAEGRLRKLEYALPQGKGQFHLSFELYDYGTDVKVATPPASEIIDLANVIGR